MAAETEALCTAEAAPGDQAVTASSSPISTEQAPTILSLPAELRNLIFSFAVATPGRTLRQVACTNRFSFDRQPPLLRSCRQIRQEACPIYIAETPFVAYYSFDHANKREVGDCRVNRWLTLLGPELASHITSLTVKIANTDLEVLSGRVKSRLGAKEGAECRGMVKIQEQNRQGYSGSTLASTRASLRAHRLAMRAERLMFRKKDVIAAFGLDALGVRMEAIDVWYELKKTEVWREITEEGLVDLTVEDLAGLL